jgi:DMSO/TMAO reductase YedYZ molybdopterin-dependent catalytic subunit
MIRTLFATIVCCVCATAAFAAPERTESFAIKGSIDHPRTVTLADLQEETPTTVEIAQRTAHGPLTGKFTGVPLWSLLQEAGVTAEPGKKNDMLRHTVTITASDGYSTVLSLGELSPEFGAEQAIIAYAQSGKLIAGANGFARLIIAGDKAAGRAISAIATIEVH